MVKTTLQGRKVVFPKNDEGRLMAAFWVLL
jgi:hypothetical protein